MLHLAEKTVLKSTAPKSLDKFIINFDNNEIDIVSGSFLLNSV